MGLQAVLLACLGESHAPESYSRQAAIELHARGCHAEAGAHMVEVFRRSKDANDRRAAATFAVGAYRDAFTASADRQAGAEHLCSGLAIADEYLASGEAGAARLATPRTQLVKLREPFGACPQVAPVDLLPVTPRRVVEDAPPPEPVIVARRPTTTRPGRAMMWTGAGLAVTGITTAAVGLGVGVSQAATAAAGADRITAGAPGRGFTDAEHDELRALRGDLDHAQVVLGTTIAVGAAVLVTGVVLTAIAVKRRPPRLAVGPWQRGVVFALRF